MRPDLPRARGPVTVLGKQLAPPRHICCFFDSRNQEHDTVVPYFAEGIRNGEKVLTICDSDSLADHLARLTQGGIDVESAQRSGHLCAACSDDTYLAGGNFCKERMFNLLKEELEQLEKSPFTRLRTRGDMSWALRNMPGTEELLEYESEVNSLLDHYDAVFMCVYDANQVTGSAMLDILSTHTHVVISNVLHENPYYMKPADYRRTFLARRAASSALVADQKMTWLRDAVTQQRS